jgi:DNA-binding XRE family transcriptional regulator
MGSLEGSPVRQDDDIDDELADEHTATAGATREPSSRANLKNRVRRLREDRLLSKAELARKAGISALTIDRIERGKPCRMDTKRKIILALGMRIEDKNEVFQQADDDEADGMVDDNAT